MAVIREFRTFIMRGNVIDLAVGVIIGSAFNAVIQSLVKDIFTPAIGLVFNFHFVGLDYHRGTVPTIFFGDFLNTVISFLLVAFAVFFVVVKPMNIMAARRAAKVAPEEPVTKSCPYCASEIAIVATRCPFCTSNLDCSTSDPTPTI